MYVHKPHQSIYHCSISGLPSYCSEKESGGASNWDWWHCKTDNCQSHPDHYQNGYPRCCRFIAPLCWSNLWYWGVHAVDSLFQQKAILLVDASNAFNSLNRLSALHNIRWLCPSLATALINSYRAPTELFVDGEVLYLGEGTTQEDRLAMPMYALATIYPLSRSYNVTFVMSVKCTCGMKMMLLQLEKSIDYMNGGAI